jgi:hypothetical protein
MDRLEVCFINLMNHMDQSQDGIPLSNIMICGAPMGLATAGLIGCAEHVLRDAGRPECPQRAVFLQGF